MILTREEDIKNITKNNESLENDKNTYSKEIEQLNEQLISLTDKIAFIDEKFG